MARKNKPTKRAKFRVYSRFCSLIEKSMASSRVPPEMRNLKGWQALRAISKMNDEFASPINKLIMSAEVNWESTGSHALFVQQRDIDALLDGKYSLNKLPEMFTPYKAFTLCLPAEFEVKGIKPGGVLVSTYPDMSDYNACLQTVFAHLDMEGVAPPDGLQQGSDIMTISYMDSDGAHSVLSYYGRELETIFKAKSFAEYKKSIYDVEGITQTEANLSDDEKELQYVLIKLIVSLSIFAMTKTNAIVDGFPKVKGFVMDHPFGEKVQSTSLTTPFKTRSVSEHHRSWFIRQLSHEKYYQGDYANWAPNSRFVFVEDTVVNSKIHPKHLER